MEGDDVAARCAAWSVEAGCQDRLYAAGVGGFDGPARMCGVKPRRGGLILAQDVRIMICLGIGAIG
jgi:hypothetical protein